MPDAYEVATWGWPEPVRKALIHAADLSDEHRDKLIEALSMVSEDDPAVRYECPSGHSWRTSHRPTGCPLCGAPNCDLIPKP